MLPCVTQPPAPAPPPYPVAAPNTAERIRIAWQQRYETDYVFEFWSALGWTVLTLGIYAFYILYQLMRRDRDHIRRRLELLDAATTFAWERAYERGLGEELTPAFQRIAPAIAALRAQTGEFRDPVLWTLIDFVTGGIGRLVAYILMDGDLVRHDRAEGAIESELSAIYERLGASVPAPDPGRMKGEQNYVARVLVTIVTCGIYGLWWLYDVMVDWNRHFQHNWRWEDGLAASVQSLLTGQGG
jgi:hypothetical protein